LAPVLTRARSDPKKEIRRRRHCGDIATARFSTYVDFSPAGRAIARLSLVDTAHHHRKKEPS
jgi:transcriptional regulator NrdR family protein